MALRDLERCLCDFVARLRGGCRSLGIVGIVGQRIDLLLRRLKPSKTSMAPKSKWTGQRKLLPGSLGGPLWQRFEAIWGAAAQSTFLKLLREVTGCLFAGPRATKYCKLRWFLRVAIFDDSFEDVFLNPFWSTFGASLGGSEGGAVW